jgi:hypothetical protein
MISRLSIYIYCKSSKLIDANIVNYWIIYFILEKFNKINIVLNLIESSRTL